MPSLRMRSLRRAALGGAVVLLAVPATAAGQQQTQDTARLPESLREARTEWRAAISALDGRAAGPFFAEDAIADVDGEVFSGRATILEAWLVPALGSLARIRLGDATFTLGDGEVVERASHAIDPGDGSGEQPGDHLVRWRRMEDGTWKVVRLEVHG